MYEYILICVYLKFLKYLRLHFLQLLQFMTSWEDPGHTYTYTVNIFYSEYARHFIPCYLR
jgi:hypothetical protein